MCGISGQISLKKDKNVSEKIVRDMLNIIGHRGPDESGIYKFRDAAIGNTRLVVTGRKTGKQPFIKNNKGLAFNGEIYNYKNLTSKGADSDTEVLFELLEKNGMNCLPKLNGVFSFSYVSDDYIYLVRDRFGERPLYYTIVNGQLFFASEIKAFRDFISFALKLPPEYSALETAIHQNTIFKDIYQVEAGTYLKIERSSGVIQSHRYFEYLPKHSERNEKDQVQDLKSLVSDAINLRSPEDLPYGIYISGGLDSSIIAMLSKPSALFTYVPESEFTPSEEKYADIVAAEKPGSIYKKKTVSSTGMLLEIIQAIYANDGPTTTLAAYSQYILAKEASDQGLRVMLGGLGADEFFNGYIRHAVGALPESSLSRSTQIQYRTLINKAKINGEEASSISVAYARLLNRSVSESEWLQEEVASVFEMYQDPLVAMSMCDALFTLPPLMSTDDRLNMAFGIESRNPLLDYRVVEFALSMSFNQKIRPNKNGAILKHALKEAFKDDLPREIYNRSDKVGFSSSVIDLLETRWNSFAQNCIKILRDRYPDEPYFFMDQNVSVKYNRWSYQMIQLAITHLLFCEKIDPLDIYTVIARKAKLLISV